MSLETFLAALDYCDTYCTIGGGEPTIHPQFERFLLVAMSHPNCSEGVHIITNGKHKERAAMLLGLAKVGAVSAELSLDDWHEPIDNDTYLDWTKEADRARKARVRHNSDTSRVGIRNTTDGRDPIASGRARTELEFERGEDYTCPCEDLVVTPSGDVQLCGCDDAPIIGDVLAGFNIPQLASDGDNCTRYLEEVSA